MVFDAPNNSDKVEILMTFPLSGKGLLMSHDLTPKTESRVYNFSELETSEPEHFYKVDDVVLKPTGVHRWKTFIIVGIDFVNERYALRDLTGEIFLEHIEVVDDIYKNGDVR